MKNFLFLGLLVLELFALFICAGCGTYIMSGKDEMGNVRLVSSTYLSGTSVPYYGTLTIVNNTSYPFYVYQGGFVISVLSDKKTKTMIDPGCFFYADNNAPVIGRNGITWTLAFRNKEDSINIGSLSSGFPVHRSFIWTISEESGQFVGRVEEVSNCNYDYNYNFRYGY